MKKILYNVCRPLFAAMFIAAAFVACNGSDPVNSDPVPTGTPMKAPVPVASDVASKGFILTWAGVENATVYGYSVTDGSEEVRGGAPEEGLTYTTKLSVRITDLKPATVYTVRVKAVTKVGPDHADSEFAEIKVTTTQMSSVENPFDIKQDVLTPTGIVCTITPKDPEMLYFAQIPSTAAVEQVGTAMDYGQRYLSTFLEAPEDYWLYWTTVDMTQTTSFKKGVYEYNDLVGLRTGREYTMIVWGLDVKTRELIGCSTHTFTPKDSGVTNSFDLTLHARGFQSAHLSIIPKDKKLTYLFKLARADEYGNLSDDGIIKSMMADYGNQLHSETGDITPEPGEGGHFARLDIDTEYFLYVVGNVKNKPTTTLTKLSFRTRKKEFNKVGLSLANVKPGTVRISNAGASEVTKDLVEVYATMVPNADTVSFMAYCLPVAAVDAMTEQQLGDEIFKQNKDYWNQWIQNNNYHWAFKELIAKDSDYYVVAIAHGPNGVFGPISKHKIVTTPGTTIPSDPNPNPEPEPELPMPEL